MDRTSLSVRDSAHLIHPVTEPKQIASRGPRMTTSGDGAWITDETGRRIIDGFAGLWCSNVGHGRKEIVDAVAKQMSILEYATTFHGHSHPMAIDLAERITSMFPSEWGLTHVMFSSGGSEANETNFKLVRMYWSLMGEDRRKTIVARNHGYHGLTIATMSATGIMPMHWNFGPEAPGFAHIPAPYCYRCDLGKTFPSCQLACADALEEYVIEAGPETVGAFIAEPVFGASGIIPPPPGYFARIREICDKYGILFIADEVVCGFGRTGTMFGMEQFDVRPDIVTLAKGITSGYIPLGASVVSGAMWEAISDKLPDRMPLSHGFTYSGHPVACAAAMANIDIIERENLVANAADVGAYLKERLDALGEAYDSVGEVRGMGLMAGLELVADKETRRGFSRAHAAVERVEQEAWDRGLYCRAMGIEVIGLAPPLTVDRDLVDQMVEILSDSLSAMEADVMARERSRRPREQVANVHAFFSDVVAGRLTKAEGTDLEVDVVFDLSGDGGGQWKISVSGGRGTVVVYDPADPVLARVVATADDFLKIINGELSGADAFMSERVRVEGDLAAAAALLSLGIL